MPLQVHADGPGRVPIRAEAATGLPNASRGEIRTPGPSRPVPVPRGGRRRVLVVEDEQDIADLIRHTLERGGDIEVEVAASGDGALKACTEQPPDLVLLDLNLPGLNGHELLAEIKGDPALLRIPVVVLTSSASPSDVLAAYGAHANAYLIKPEDYDEFLSLVGSIRNHWLTSVLLPSQVA